MSTTSTPQFLRIRLEGSFCVVIQKKSSYKIRAGTPKDPDHLFAMNGQQIEPRNSFHFELKPHGLQTYTSWPEIDPAFDWSNKTTNKWDNNNSYYFISMDLPCPKQIMQDCTTRVIFDDFSSGLMPRNHILIYEIKDFSKLKITSNTPNPAKINQNGVFSLEIGLPLESSPNKVHDHTINCHNNMLKKFFPDLHKDKRCRLKDIEVPGSLLDTTTLECKSGGMIVGYPS
jgi:hypothetical protein